MLPTHPEPTAAMTCSGRTSERGFAIVSAIFLIVVLAALGTYMVSFSTAQHMTALQDLQGAKAYQAARTGIEWAAYQIRQQDNGSFATACRGGQNTVVLPGLGAGLGEFQVSVHCTQASRYNEGAADLYIHQIQATASSTAQIRGHAGYVERQIEFMIEK